MSKKVKDAIILMFISIIPTSFFLFLGYCDFADYQDQKNGFLCDCRSEFGADYAEFFIKGLISIISGIIIVCLRIILDKKARKSLRLTLFVGIFIISILLFIL